MELRLDAPDVEVLSRILTNYLSDLRMEISDTDSAPMREALKSDEAIITSLIAQLSKSTTRLA